MIDNTTPTRPETDRVSGISTAIETLNEVGHDE